MINITLEYIISPRMVNFRTVSQRTGLEYFEKLGDERIQSCQRIYQRFLL